MGENTEKRVRLAATLIISTFILLGVYLLFSKGLGCLLPFLLALVTAYLMEPIVRFFEKRLRFKRMVATAATILLILLVLLSVVGYLIYILVLQVINLSTQLPQMMEQITKYVTDLLYQWDIQSALLPQGLSQFAENVLLVINQNLENIVQPLTQLTLNGAKSFVAGLPNFGFFLVIYIIATFFISMDKMKIATFLVGQMSNSAKEKLYRVKDFLVNAFLKYMKALLILMFITFLQLFIGFAIIRIDNALLLALLVSVVDILPVFGTGTVLIPWGAVCLLLGDIRTGLSLLILYAVISLVRQFIEPKIVSVQIGLYPLVTLLAMYVGFKFFGFLGMFYGPLFMIVLICLHQAGIFRLYKEPQTKARPAKPHGPPIVNKP